MTIAEATPIFRYDGDDNATNFPFTQIFYEDDDLLVIRLELDGVTETILVKDADYTVNGVLTTSGSVDYPISGDPLATGEQLTVRRITDKDRVTDLQGIFKFSTVNNDADRAVAMAQEALELLSRCATFKASNGDTPPTLEALMVGTGDGNHANLDKLAYALSGHTGFMENIHFLLFDLVELNTDCAVNNVGLRVGFPMPFDGTFLQSDTIRHLYAFNETAGVTGTATVDILLNGTSIMTTDKISIVTTEKDSFVAGTQPVLTTTAFSAGDIVQITQPAIRTTPGKGLSLLMAVRQS
jgi:hypothetical protein